MTDPIFADTRAQIDIQASVALTVFQDVEYSEPPPKVIPLRHFRAVMGDYRIAHGVPVSPPVCDAQIPVIVNVDPKGVAVPDLDRPLPEDISTGAQARWIASDAYVTYSPEGSTCTWLDRNGAIAWTAYDTWQPLLDQQYNYQIPKDGRAQEVLYRAALVFEAALGICMNTSLSINPSESVDAIEFILVVWSHPFTPGQNTSNILDIGDAVRGISDLPTNLSDSMTGARLRVVRPSEDRLSLHQGNQTLNLPANATITSGRPVIIRARFGERPLLAWWGPKGHHQWIWTTTKATSPVTVPSNYILGRQRNLISGASNAGMHVFEINYYDHGLDDDTKDGIVHRLNSVYAVTG